MHTQPIVLGTAGHIDHGKTALVRALTGIDTDRLKVEKERGITTELGFAYLDLDGRRYGVVDVPGHERFIKAMVAGAGGLDLVCLVIAADEGIMPQTREHLDICQLLGVRRGVVALTKSDLVDDEWLELVAEEIRGELASTFLAEANIVPVSSRTGAGLDELRAELTRLAADLPARTAEGAFRMPLDRVFTIRGFGTVVTGTIIGGSVKAGDAVVAQPSGVSGKVRGIQVHGSEADTAQAGMRCAINLTGPGRDELARGDTLIHPDAVETSHLLDVRFRYLRTSKGPLPRRSRVLVHHGTSQLMATLVLVGADKLDPGAQALAQLRLDATTPLCALPGDRFIARSFVVQEHYGTTIGGGEILRVSAPKVRRSSKQAVQAVRDVADAAGDERVALEVKTSSFAGVSVDDLTRRLDRSGTSLRAALQRLEQQREVIHTGRGAAAVYCHAEPFSRLEKRALDTLDAFYEANPHEQGMSRQELRARLPQSVPARLFEALLEALSQRGAIVAERDLVARKRRLSAAGDELSEVEASVAEQFEQWGIEAPKPKNVASELGGDARAIRAAMDRLLKLEVLVRVKSDYYAHHTAVDALRDKLVAHLDARGEITPPEWKALTGVTRKYAIPLAEYFDAEKLTLRVGDIRKRRG